MALLKAKLGEWDVPHLHRWRDRETTFVARPAPILSQKTRVATIGSCFAENLAKSAAKLKLQSRMHPVGLFYNTRSVRQELERIFNDDRRLDAEGVWTTKNGLVHPFKSYFRTFATGGELRTWSDELDTDAAALFRDADVIAITIGLIEAWRNPTTGVVYRELPHPDVFDSLQPEFFRLKVSEMVEDLEAIVALIQANTSAEIVLTVSPVPLNATFTASDVRVANSESKGRIRAAVGEVCEAHPEIHYFHSYELVTTAERQSDFMMKDRRHVHPHAVDFIMQRFITTFTDGSVVPPEVDIDWLMAPLAYEKEVLSPAQKAKKRINEAIVRRKDALSNTIKSTLKS